MVSDRQSTGPRPDSDGLSRGRDKPRSDVTDGVSRLSPYYDAVKETRYAQEPSHKRPPMPVWAIGAAALAAALLVWLQPTEQDATLAALVLGGKIPVQPASLMGHYFFGTWTLINQAGGLLLWLGLPQPGLDYAYDFAFVAATLVSYAMIVYGFGAKPLFALFAALFCFLSGFLVHIFVSPDYSAGWTLWDHPDPYTYGAAAYAGTSLVIGSLAGGRNRLAGFVAAVLIAVHPVVGTFMGGMLIVGVLGCRLLMPSVETTGIAKGYFCGLIVVALSLAAFLIMRPVPGHTIDTAAYHNYMKFWEYHRARPFEPTALIPVLAAALVPGLIFISSWRRESPARLAALVVLLSALASGTLYVAFYLLRDHAPQIFVAAMPSRLISVHAAIAGAFAIGLGLWAYQGLLSERANSARARRLFVSAPWLALIVLAFLVPPSIARTLPEAATDLAQQLRGVGRLTMNNGAFWIAVRRAHIKTPVLVTAAASHDSQRFGHLPVLLDVVQIDFVPYLPFTAHQVAEIIEKGYGVSFSAPPIANVDDLPVGAGRAYWEALDLHGWNALGGELGFGAVLAPSEWHVALPVLIAGPEFSLYRVPGG